MRFIGICANVRTNTLIPSLRFPYWSISIHPNIYVFQLILVFKHHSLLRRSSKSSTPDSLFLIYDLRREVSAQRSRVKVINSPIRPRKKCLFPEAVRKKKYFILFYFFSFSFSFYSKYVFYAGFMLIGCWEFGGRKRHWGRDFPE